MLGAGNVAATRIDDLRVDAVAIAVGAALLVVFPADNDTAVTEEGRGHVLRIGRAAERHRVDQDLFAPLAPAGIEPLANDVFRAGAVFGPQGEIPAAWQRHELARLDL